MFGYLPLILIGLLGAVAVVGLVAYFSSLSSQRDDNMTY